MLYFSYSRYDAYSILLVGSVLDGEIEGQMVTVKSSQKIFTDAEIASLTGICVDHIRNFAKSRHLGFIARAAEAAGAEADKWLFTNSDLLVLAVLVERCEH